LSRFPIIFGWSSIYPAARTLRISALGPVYPPAGFSVYRVPFRQHFTALPWTRLPGLYRHPRGRTFTFEKIILPDSRFVSTFKVT